METVTVFPPNPQCLMTPPIAFKPAPQLLLRLTPAAFRLFATTSSAAAPTTSIRDPEIVTVPEPRLGNPSPVAVQGAAQGRKSDKNGASEDSNACNADSGWVIGVDPDLSGALAVLKPDNSPQVYDSPHLKVLVGNRVRKRLDTKSIIQLLQSVDAPIGTSVYIEQSIPYPQDGKQSIMLFCSAALKIALTTVSYQTESYKILDGWWSGGFGYGLWIGILVTSGYSVVPVPSSLWKKEFKLTGTRSSKDESRELATTLFPSLSSLLKRKKDHGRAEALLIAAFGKGLKVNHDSSCILEDLMPEKQDNLQAAIL
ncbi:hypothetical protein DH2020_046444 [Rehmannia glutinosa]|uniref:Holliday junction resolvase-like protein n=1 Tax=Rehmannia glutinosa TaxID=99300 RepID=A0ABR0UBV0_REHGL